MTLRRDMTNKTWWTWLSGALFVVVLIVGFMILGDGVDPTEDSAREVVDYYVDNDTTLWISVILEMLAAALLVYFGAHVRHAFRAADVLGPVIFAGTIITAAGAAFDATLTAALVELTDDPDVAIAPGAVQALAGLYNNDYVPMALGLALFTTAVGLATVRHGVLPKWLGIVAIILGIVAFTPAGFISFGLTGLWIIGASIYMALQAKKV
jgi:hypothetical protein